MNKINSSDRRHDDGQSVLWDHQKILDCGDIRLGDRRVNAETVRALANMLHTVKMRRGQGLIFALVNDDKTLDLGFTGKMFENPLIATWAVDQLQRLLEHLPGHPVGRQWES